MSLTCGILFCISFTISFTISCISFAEYLIHAARFTAERSRRLTHLDWNWPTKPSFNSMNSIPWIQLMVHNVSVLSVYLLHVSFWHKLHANCKRLNAFLVAIFWFTWFEHRLGFVWPFLVLSDPFQTAGVPQGDINWPNGKLGLQHICPRLFHRIWWSMSSFWKKW